MSEETTNQQSCGGKKRAMLAYVLVQISATVVSAVSLAAIAWVSVPRSRRAACSTAAWKPLWPRGAPKPKPFATAMAVEIQFQSPLRVLPIRLVRLRFGRDQAFVWG